MTEDGWGTPLEWISKEEALKKWPDPNATTVAALEEAERGEGEVITSATAINQIFQNNQAIERQIGVINSTTVKGEFTDGKLVITEDEIHVGFDLGSTGQSSIVVVQDDKVIRSSGLHKQGSNLVDDEGQLYFQCNGCEAMLDPNTKSFKTLHDVAHKRGWKVKWNTNGLGYKIYCVKCGD